MEWGWGFWLAATGWWMTIWMSLGMHRQTKRADRYERVLRQVRMVSTDADARRWARDVLEEP